VAGGGEQVVEVGGGAVDRDQARVGEAAGGGLEQGSVDLDGVELGVGGHGDASRASVTVPVPAPSSTTARALRIAAPCTIASTRKRELGTKEAV
jgi:hypothetical protein